MTSEQKVNESEVDYAYAVLDAIVEAMDKVAAKPELGQLFMIDLLRKMPKFADALMIITPNEHRLKMAELVKASARMCGAWLKKMKR